MNKFEKLEDGIFRLCIPFDNIYTTVFLLKSKKGIAIIDSATYPQDAENYIFPALNEIDVTPQILLCSHMHSDHNGALSELSKLFPDMKIGLFFGDYSLKNAHYFNDGDILFNRFKILNLKGHTLDCLGVLDLKTKTLITCDALQQKGVGKYKPFAESKEEYLKTINRIEGLDVSRIICSHDYEPFGFSVTKKDISKLLEICKNNI